MIVDVQNGWFVQASNYSFIYLLLCSHHTLIKGKFIYFVICIVSFYLWEFCVFYTKPHILYYCELGFTRLMFGIH